jgi:DEAD/DEAH box helicase domain-containing protein
MEANFIARYHMSVRDVIEEIVSHRSTRHCVSAVKHIEPRPAVYAPFPSGLLPETVSAIKEKGMERLYLHQARAMELALKGENVVVVTPTASGKTLCYNAPVLDSILRDHSSRAIYLFPTKALSQDQVAELQDLSKLLRGGIRCSTYDGDTPQDARKAIRTNAHIVATNPDMLHTGILPHHTRWAKFFQNLNYVVIDEVHGYRGVFGSHLTNVIRRLKRICRFYAASPRFIMCSATIANPSELAAGLIEEKVELVDENGAPQGEKYLLFYNPPVVNRELGIRANYVSEARKLTLKFLKAGVKTIVFTTNRLNVEVLLKYLRDGSGLGLEADKKIKGYRGGYLPLERREIEKGLREGEVLGVVSTNALELGIDIGHLDCAVMTGYPGTVASTWQQAGRAGRRSEVSAALLVARSNPLDQFMVGNPDYFLGRSPEKGLINPDNLTILLSHIKCAAFELPFEDDESFGGEDLGEILDFLQEKGVVHHQGGRWHWTSDHYPANSVSLRSIDPDNFVVVDTTEKNRAIAEVDRASVPTTIYQNAIFMVQGQQYHVDRLDYDEQKAYVTQVSCDYYTEALTYSGVRVLDLFESCEEEKLKREHGEVHVVNRASGYKKIKFYTLENLGYGDVNLPQQEMHTTACWFTPNEEVLNSLDLGREELLDGLMGISYLLHHIATFLLMCDINDIDRCIGDRSAGWFTHRDNRGRGIYSFDLGAEEIAPESLELFNPTIFLYDNYPGGIGFSQELYQAQELLFSKAIELIDKCGCEQGCPSCVGPVGEVGPGSKEAARRLLTVIR